MKYATLVPPEMTRSSYRWRYVLVVVSIFTLLKRPTQLAIDGLLVGGLPVDGLPDGLPDGLCDGALESEGAGLKDGRCDGALETEGAGLKEGAKEGAHPSTFISGVINSVSHFFKG